MSQLERQQNIFNALRELNGGSISIKELAARFYASESSVRRDILSLEARGLVTHIYGGVMLADYQNSVTPLNIRDSEHTEAKERIAAEAAEMICNGETILLDSSSTARRILKYLAGKENLRIISNSLRIFTDCELPHAKLYCTGGRYDPQNHNFLGPDAEAYIHRISADRVFFSSQGLSDAGEINDVSEEEISMRRAMLLRAKQSVFLCDSSKLGRQKMFTLCSISEVDRVICDQPERIEELRGQHCRG